MGCFFFTAVPDAAAVCAATAATASAGAVIAAVTQLLPTCCMNTLCLFFVVVGFLIHLGGFLVSGGGGGGVVQNGCFFFWYKVGAFWYAPVFCWFVGGWGVNHEDNGWGTRLIVNDNLCENHGPFAVPCLWMDYSSSTLFLDGLQVLVFCSMRCTFSSTVLQVVCVWSLCFVFVAFSSHETSRFGTDAASFVMDVRHASVDWGWLCPTEAHSAVTHVCCV